MHRRKEKENVINLISGSFLFVMLLSWCFYDQAGVLAILLRAELEALTESISDSTYFFDIFFSAVIGRVTHSFHVN